jgi:uncharacterized protein YciI
MNFIVIGMDKGDLRRERRAAHLDYVAARQDRIVYAGPLIESGRMIGSLFVFDLPDRDALDAHLAGDPYFADGGIFETVTVYESRMMVPEPRPNFLAEEAERARAQG